VDALLTLSTYRGYAVTRLAGVFGQAMAEYCMMHILAQVGTASLVDTPKVPAHAVSPASWHAMAPVLNARDFAFTPCIVARFRSTRTLVHPGERHQGSRQIQTPILHIACACLSVSVT
jgi:hypothetical protein